MNLKEMKALATEKGIEFKKNAGEKKMRQLLGMASEQKKEEGSEEAPKQETPEAPKEAKEEKIYLGLHPISGEKVYK